MKRNLLMGLVISILAPVALCAFASQVPSVIPYTGHITGADGIDTSANLSIEVRLYDSFIAGIGQGIENSHVIYAEKHNSVRVDNGNLRLFIGSGIPLSTDWSSFPVGDLVSKEEVYIELWINGERLSPRQKIGAIPAAIKAEYAKYADQLATLPDISEAMMPVYDASKITSGVFAQDQIPNLSAANFVNKDPATSKPVILPSSTIPSFTTGQFLTGGNNPKLSTALLPNGIDAAKIVGTPLPASLFPPNIVTDSDVSVGYGTLAHHEMLRLPDGFTPGQCGVSYSLGDIAESAEHGLHSLSISLDNNFVLSCEYTGHHDVNKIFNCKANYIYVCVKS